MLRPIIFACVIIFLSTSLSAQSEPIHHFYQQYRDNDHATRLNLKGGLLRIASGFTDDKDARRILRKVSHLRLLVVEEDNPVSAEAYTQLIRGIQSDRFEPLIQVREGKQRIEFFMRENGDTITDLLMLLHDEGEFIMLSLEGKLQFSDLNDLQIDVDGAQHLSKLPESRPRA